MVRHRIGFVRVALGWAALDSFLLCLGLPLTTPSSMPRAAWVSFGVLTGLLVIALFGIVAVTRRPRTTISLLAIAAVYAAVMLVDAGRALFSLDTSELPGPGRALAFVLAASLGVAIIVAFLLARPLWAGRNVVGPGEPVRFTGE